MNPYGLSLVLWLLASPAAPEPPVSPATQGCLDCHADVTPALVVDWRASAHARTTPAQASTREGAADYVVGCAECHAHAPESHPDTFDHGDARVHVVVTPRDCAACHPVEVDQFGEGLMAHAYGNLVDNPLYQDLVAQSIRPLELVDGRLVTRAPSAGTEATSCLACHGTRVRVAGEATRETPAGELTFPLLEGWPNQGVGRVNPDGSRGSCSACHMRHRFSAAQGRHAEACAGCHKGPDVPAYAVWKVSRHGMLADATVSTTDFEAVPWVAGRDFRAPTCAACHLSGVVAPTGEVVAERTHRLSERLATRLFGLPYAHPHPASPATHAVRNSAGLALPTELDGRPVASAVIDAAEQQRRTATMKRVCGACHAQGWVQGHFARLDDVIVETNVQTKAATDLLALAWAKGLARGPAEKASPFDEPLERTWVETWLFYANSTRFAAAMGGADYGVFAGGRWQLTKAVREMEAWVRERLGVPGDR
jgi:hypothetical protein